MPYNQIAANGTIVSGANPITLSAVDIKKQIETDLNRNDYTFKWNSRRSQPYSGVLDDGDNQIDVYIYAWNMTPAYRANPSEKRIQIRASVDNIGINRPITSTQKTIILGLYNSASGTPLYAAWDPSVNVGHGQKSCYVQIEDVAKAITDGIYQTTDRNGAPIFTIAPDFLADYISSLQAGNAINVPPGPRTLKTRVRAAGTSKHKKRVLKSVESLKSKIANLSNTEQETVIKARVGQGYFRDLLINKYSCKCALCNISTETMLRASHIKSWKQSTDAEKLDENNGLLLCAHHDALFDKHLITFDNLGNVQISPTLSTQEQMDLGLTTLPSIAVTPAMLPYLAVHQSKLRR